MLLQLSQFSPFASLHPAPFSPGNPHIAVPVHGSHIYVPLLPGMYFISPWLFCNYQVVLHNLFAFFANPPDSLPSGSYQNVLCIYDFVSVLLNNTNLLPYRFGNQSIKWILKAAFFLKALGENSFPHIFQSTLLGWWVLSTYHSVSDYKAYTWLWYYMCSSLISPSLV